MDVSIRRFVEEHILFKDYASNTNFIDTLTGLMKTRVFSDGTYMIRKGEVGRAMFFVVRGEVEVISEDGETIINVLSEQSFFGEIGLLFSIPRTVSCRSRGRSIILILTKESLANAVAPYPRIAQSISQIAEERFASHVKHKESAVTVEFGEELQLGITQNDLKTIPLFRTCEIGFLHNLALTLNPVRYRNGELIIRKGDIAREMFFVVRGTAEVFDEVTDHVFAQFHPGSFFGEVGLFFQIKRSGSVRCSTPELTVFKLLKSDLDNLLINYPEVKQKIEAEASQRILYIEAREKVDLDVGQRAGTELEVVREQLKSVTLFKDTPTAFLHDLALKVQLRVCSLGEIIIRKGDRGRSMFFIVMGAVQVVSEDLKIVYAEMGARFFFGEVALFYEVSRTATVRANAKTTLLELSAEALRDVLQQYPTIKDRVLEKAEENYQLVLQRQAAMDRLNSTHAESQQFDVDATTTRLKNVPFFSRCDEGFLRLLALKTSIQSHKLGDKVVQMGDPSTEMYFIVRGSVEIVSNDGTHIYDTVSTGGYFGEVGVIRGIARTAAIRVASETCDFIVLSAQAMRKALVEYPENFQALLIEAQKRFQCVEERSLRGEHALTHSHEGSVTNIGAVHSERGTHDQPAQTPQQSQLNPDQSQAQSQQVQHLSDTTFIKPISTLQKQTSSVKSVSTRGSATKKQNQHQDQDQQSQEPAPIEHLTAEDFQTPGEKKTLSPFGQLFTRHNARKRKEEIEPSRLKRDANTSQDSLVDPEPKRGMSAAGEVTLSVPAYVERNASAATTVQKDVPQVQRALGKMFQSIKNTLQRKDSSKVGVAGNGVETASTGVSSNRQSTAIAPQKSALTNRLREDTLRRLNVPGHAPVSNILELDEHFLSVVMMMIPPLEILRLRAVCRRWNELLLLPQFWSKLNLKPEFRKVNRRAIEVLSYLGGDSLIRIDLTGCWMLHDEDLSSLVGQCPNIKTLCLTNCWKLTDVGLAFVAQYCPRLINLNISYCGQMTGAGFTSHQWSGLRRINISYCKQVVDEHLERLLSQTSELQDIKMRRCPRISDFGIFLVVRYCRKLRSLDLRDLEHITDRCLKWIASSCYNLVDLNLSFCSRITNTGLYDLSLGAQKFQRLDFSNCPLLTDAAIIFFSDNIRSLKYISLRQCKKMTDGVVAYLARTAVKLKFVDLTGCPNVTAAAKQKLEHALPGVMVRLDRSPESRGVRKPGKNGKPKAIELQPCERFTSGPKEMMMAARALRKNSISSDGSDTNVSQMTHGNPSGSRSSLTSTRSNKSGAHNTGEAGGTKSTSSSNNSLNASENSAARAIMVRRRGSTRSGE